MLLSPQIRIFLKYYFTPVWSEVLSIPLPIVYLFTPHTEVYWATYCNYSYMLHCLFFSFLKILLTLKDF